MFGSGLKSVWGLKRVASAPFNLTYDDILLNKIVADRTQKLLRSDESSDGTENLWKTTKESKL